MFLQQNYSESENSTSEDYDSDVCYDVKNVSSNMLGSNSSILMNLSVERYDWTTTQEGSKNP